MTDNELILENIAFSFEGSERMLFHGLNARFPLRGVSLVLGPNAAGKTTLARLIAGFESPLGGQVIWPETASVANVVWHAPRAGIVFEEPDIQFQTFELYDEISIGLLHCGVSQQQRERRVAEVASRLGLEEALGKPLESLEWQGKLAALCASFAALGLRALVLDFSPLSRALEQKFLEKLFSLSRRGECPALICLSREAEDMAFLEPGEKAFLLHDSRMEELTPDLGNTHLLERLESAGVRLPWYLPLSRELHRRGRLDRMLYPGSAAFLKALTLNTPRSDSPDL